MSLRIPALEDIQRGNPHHDLGIFDDFLHRAPAFQFPVLADPAAARGRQQEGTRRNRVLTATMQDPGGGSQRQTN
jgi:hypothetical protein